MVDDGLRMDLASALAMEKRMFIDHIGMMGTNNFEHKRSATIEKGRLLTGKQKE